MHPLYSLYTIYVEIRLALGLRFQDLEFYYIVSLRLFLNYHDLIKFIARLDEYRYTVEREEMLGRNNQVCQAFVSTQQRQGLHLYQIVVIVLIANCNRLRYAPGPRIRHTARC